MLAEVKLPVPIWATGSAVEGNENDTKQDSKLTNIVVSIGTYRDAMVEEISCGQGKTGFQEVRISKHQQEREFVAS